LDSTNWLFLPHFFQQRPKQQTVDQSLASKLKQELKDMFYQDQNEFFQKI